MHSTLLLIVNRHREAPFHYLSLAKRGWSKTFGVGRIHHRPCLKITLYIFAMDQNAWIYLFREKKCYLVKDGRTQPDRANQAVTDERQKPHGRRGQRSFPVTSFKNQQIIRKALWTQRDDVNSQVVSSLIRQSYIDLEYTSDTTVNSWPYITIIFIFQKRERVVEKWLLPKRIGM